MVYKFKLGGIWWNHCRYIYKKGWRAPGNDEGGISSGQVKVYEYIDASGDWYQVGDNINGKEAGELSGKSWFKWIFCFIIKWW